MHKTTNINDDYYGSGNCIKASIKKYGIENFEKTILHVFIRRKDAVNKEKELVTEELIKNPLCYNLTVGGYGGFFYIRQQNKHTSCEGKKIIHNKTTKEITKVHVNNLQKYIDNGWELGFSPESLERMSKSGKKRIRTKEENKKNSETKKNSYIVEHIITKKRKFIKKDCLDEYIRDGWCLFDRNKNIRGNKFIYNPNTNICKSVNSKDLNKYIKDGWIKGRNPSHKTGAKRGTRYIFNPITKKTKRVNKENIDNFLGNGWIEGMGPKKR